MSLKAYGATTALSCDVVTNCRFSICVMIRTFYLVCLALAALWLIITAFIVRSRFGFVLSGLRQNERRMVALGISPYPYKLVGFIIAGAGAGLAAG